MPVLEGLAGEGVDIVLFSFEKPSKETEIRAVSEKLARLGIDWQRLKYHKYPKIASTFFDIMAGYLLALKASLCKRGEVIHCRSYVPMCIGVMLKLTLGGKLIFDMRGYWADERTEGSIWKKNGLLYRLTKYIEKNIFIKLSDTIVVLTNASLRDIKARWGLSDKQLACIPTSVEFNNFSLLMSGEKYTNVISWIKNKFCFCYLGSLGTWYALPEIFSFFVQAKSIISDCCLLFITPNGEVLDGYAEHSGISRNEWLSLMLPHEDVPGVLRHVKAGLAFYKPGYSRIACSPTKLGEYLACGLPVIINTGIGDSDEVISSNNVGYVLKGYFDSEYLDALNKIRDLSENDPGLAQRCIAVARKYFSFDDSVKKYTRLYNEFSS
jgi:glycosyltransferase involved in cell wall biosynthesis